MRIISWKKHDDAYQIWKQYKKNQIPKQTALQEIENNCGVRSFFLFYPFYKAIKPFYKAIKSFDQISRQKARERITITRALEHSKKTILLVSHEAAETDAPIFAVNLLEKLAARYNVISVLLGPCSLEKAFRNVSVATIGPFPVHLRRIPSIKDPILRVCRKFTPAFAIVNSIESREALIPLSTAGVPVVQLIHEFGFGLYGPQDILKVAKYANQIVFPSRALWEEAVRIFWPLAKRPPNIIPQARSRAPREVLDGNGANSGKREAADNERKRIEAVMRPFGTRGKEIVIAGCGVGVRKGVDLFISVAAALKQRSPNGRFHFVWIGESSPNELGYLTAQVNYSGLEGCVTFLGGVNCLDPVYATADIFMLSSRLDSFPNAAVDAMIAGLPVVCFNGASGVADMLSDHADLKRLVVPYADASSAAEIIEQLSNDDSLLKATKVAIRDLALSTFDMDRYVDRLERLAERASLIFRQEEEDSAAISRGDFFRMGYAAPLCSSAKRDDYIKDFVREGAGCGGHRCPFPGFHPGVYRNAHPELNELPFVNPLVHYFSNGEPQGPWLLDIIEPEHSLPPGETDKRVALHLHVHYPELTSELFRPIMANRTRPDVFVTVSNEKGRREVAAKAAEIGIDIEEITVVPNRGRDIGPLLTLLGGRMVKDYDIVGHLHAKVCPQTEACVGATWREFCVENLLGGKHNMMDMILDRFARDSKLGIVFPCDPNIYGWSPNLPIANALLERMGIVTELPDEFFFPVGTMFWARTDAILPLLELELDWSDYPLEPLPYDGTILHAIERLFPVVAQHRGFEIAGTYVPGVTR